jgi:hypothetical protein
MALTLEQVIEHNRRFPVSGADLRPKIEQALGEGGGAANRNCSLKPGDGPASSLVCAAKPSQNPRNERPARPPILNKTERRFRDILLARNYAPVLEQAITLRLDPPFTSYRPDLAVFELGKFVFWEVKAPHRFARAGIAKAACAAKTYPRLTFRLAMWTAQGWKETTLSP